MEESKSKKPPLDLKSEDKEEIAYEITQILPSWIEDVQTVEFIHIHVEQPKQIGPLLAYLNEKMPLMRQELSE